MRSGLATLAVIGMLFQASAAAAAPSPGRVAVLGPEKSALVPRLQRNFADPPSMLASAVVTTCSRAVVQSALFNLDADTAICTDGDVVTVWRLDGDHLILIEAIPVLTIDDRATEVLAARATIAARRREATSPSSSSSMTIVANTDEQDAASILATANQPSLPYEPAADKPAVARAPQPESRTAPRAVFSAGPALYASSAGSVAAFSGRVEIGVARHVTFVPWVMIPGVLGTSGVYGTASYRPTLFGLGFGIPLRDNSKTLVPRIGSGYALLWMHVWPESAATGATAGVSENLWAPAMYIDGALSVRVTSRFRVVGEGMLGTSTHKMVVRIGPEQTAKWGAPLASLALRAEVVLP